MLLRISSPGEWRLREISVEQHHGHANTMRIRLGVPLGEVAMF